MHAWGTILEVADSLLRLLWGNSKMYPHPQTVLSAPRLFLGDGRPCAAQILIEL